MFLNKKAQVGIIGAIFLFIVFIVMWFIWLGAWVAEAGRDAVLTNNLTGIEAFLCYNLNFFIMLFMILGVMGFMYFGVSR